MTKRLLSLMTAGLMSGLAAQAQITITAADMPVLGDKLTYSMATPGTGLNLSNTGINIAWDYSFLTPIANQTDTFKTPAQAGYTGLSGTTYGYKVADSLPLTGLPVSINNIYTFFSIQNSPSAYVANGFAAKLNGALNVTAPYTDVDEWYFLPMAFAKFDSSSFRLSASVLVVGSLKQSGWRKTSVDGWGTITTPYFTTPVQVLRVRSEVNEIDSVNFSGNDFVIPRHYIDYKWLANGEHYPALWITTTVLGSTETPTAVRYRDRQIVGVKSVSHTAQPLEVYPNPALGADVHIRVPAEWHGFTVHLFDMNGRLIRSEVNAKTIATSNLAAGNYSIVAESNGDYRVAKFVR